VSDVSVEDVGDHVAVVCMHRPPNNYFDTALLRQLVEAYEEMSATSWCRSIVLAAEGRHFCAGLDFSSNAGQDIGELYGYAARLFAAPLPVVAAVRGAAVGGGLGLALSADFRVAASTSRFSANFARLGFHHGFALTVSLPRAVGQQAAADLLFTGRRVSGDEAQAIGLCDRLVDEEDVQSGAIDLARAIAGSGPLAVRAIRATLREGLAEGVRRAMDREHTEQERLRVTKDFAEGIVASNERREPRFIGE
jgi:enoyl-CoA hydratase/carnithine racemase